MAVRRARIRIRLLLPALMALPLAAWAQGFDDLTTREQEMLAPLAESWERIPPQRRQRLVEMAGRVADASPEEQQRFQQGLERFMSLDDRERHQVRRLFERFRNLPPEERRAIIDRVMAMPEDQRRAFAFGMRIADRTRHGDGPGNGRVGRQVEDWLRDLPAERRRELISEVRDLPPPDRLRRIAEEMDKQDPGSTHHNDTE